MTDKEREKYKYNPEASKDGLKGIARLKTILPKEMAKYFQKHGYDITKDMIKIVRVSKAPFRVVVKANDENIAEYSFRDVHLQEWRENDKTIFKTLKEINQPTYWSEEDINNPQTFKEFLKKVKKYCKANGLYNEPETDLER